MIGNYGVLLAEVGRHSDAEAAHRQALEIHRKAFGDEHARVALTLNALGASLSQQQRTEEAERVFSDAVKALPETHAAWARAIRQNRVSALISLGRASEALEEISRAEASSGNSSELERRC